MPLFGKNIIIGLEIGDRVLRAVQIQHRQSRPRLLDLERQPISDGIPSDITTQGPIWSLLKSGSRAGRIVVNVPGSVALIRKIQVEASEMGYLSDWVRWEAQQYLSAPLEEYFLDFQRLKVHEESGLWQVLVVLAHRDAIQERAQLLESFHLRPGILDVDPLALHNAFELNYPSAVDFPVALVNVEQDVTTMVATHRGIPEGVITMATPAESAQLLQEIRARLDDLRQRISQNKGDQGRFSKVLFSGGSSHLDNVVDALSSDGELDVEVADPFRELTIVPTLREKLDRTFRATEFMLATGLALRKT